MILLKYFFSIFATVPKFFISNYEGIIEKNFYNHNTYESVDARNLFFHLEKR